jgi:5-keto 4-deoxyuronate isomerase
MIVTMLDVSPAVASGSVSLHSGLGIGQYSAIAFILIPGPGQSATEITSCLPFTVY